MFQSMASKLEEFLHFIEVGRYQDAAKYRETAQKEYFEAKNRLGLHDRKECESIDEIFSYVEKGLFKGASALLSKANAVFKTQIKPVTSSLRQETGKKKLREFEPNHKKDNLGRHTQLSNNKTGNDIRIHVHEQDETHANDFDDQIKRKSSQVDITSNDQRIRAKEASEKLRKDNPNIADLSDTNRPTKLAERFSELYDNEWTEAYIDLTQNHKLTERKTIDMLYNIVLTAYNFCSEEASHQIQQIQEAAISIVKQGHVDKHPVLMAEQIDTYPLMQFRKTIAACAIERLKRSFLESQKKQIGHVKCSRVLEIYVVKTVEITWWMCVQIPAVCLHREEPGIINDNLYKPYTRSGKSVDYFIWPPLLLHENGPLLSKGIVQAK